MGNCAHSMALGRAYATTTQFEPSGARGPGTVLQVVWYINGQQMTAGQMITPNPRFRLEVNDLAKGGFGIPRAAP